MTTIRPARGLWAAVDRIGLIHPATIRDSATDARTRLTILFDRPYDVLAARGWRIIRVDVIPHEEGE